MPLGYTGREHWQNASRLQVTSTGGTWKGEQLALPLGHTGGEDRRDTSRLQVISTGLEARERVGRDARECFPASGGPDISGGPEKYVASPSLSGVEATCLGFRA